MTSKNQLIWSEFILVSLILKVSDKALSSQRQHQSVLFVYISVIEYRYLYFKLTHANSCLHYLKFYKHLIFYTTWTAFLIHFAQPWKYIEIKWMREWDKDSVDRVNALQYWRKRLKTCHVQFWVFRWLMLAITERVINDSD